MTDLLERPAPAAEPAPAKSRRKWPTPLVWVSWALAAAMTYFIAFPLIKAVLSLFGVATATTGAADSTFLSVVTSGETLQALLNTAILVVCGGAFAILVGAGFAWLNERTDARVGWLAEVLPLVSMFVPSLAAAIGWVFLLDPDIGLLNSLMRTALGWVGIDAASGPLDIYSWYGLIWCYGVFLVPFAYLAISNGLQSLDPSLEEASRVSGAGPVKTFFKVTLPALKPALGSAVMIVIVMGMALFSMPVIIGTRAGIDVLPVKIVEDVTQTYPVDQVSALSRSAMLLVIVLIAGYVQRRLVGVGKGKGQAFATIGGKGSRGGAVKLGKLKAPARVLMFGYLAAAAILPFLGLLFVSLQTFWSSAVDWSGLSLDAYDALFEKPILSEGLKNSMLLAAGCATVVVLFAIIITHFTEVKGGKSARAVDGVLKTPAAIPHIVFAIALIAAFGGPPFGWNGTALILAAAYVVMYFPQAAMYSSAAVHQIGRPLIEASHVSGAGDARTLRRVLVPLMTPALISGWALIFVLMAGDITASAMLASTNTPVAGFVMLDQWSHGSYPTIAALGVVLTLISTCVVLVALRVRNKFRINR
ncbi:ABC transporter permease [Actinokineospora pegani]|uniref:ABC transporter permease n=1 Tax=Actinokineospora pegani TaxID=2654637 RepID=UPI0012EAE9A6|nr:iron ABC transporter permease [Actinokineospora pegani]